MTCACAHQVLDVCTQSVDRHVTVPDQAWDQGMHPISSPHTHHARQEVSLWESSHLAHSAFGGQTKFDIYFMCHLHSKLQQADIKEFQLAIEGEGVPINVTSVHSCLKSL